MALTVERRVQSAAIALGLALEQNPTRALELAMTDQITGERAKGPTAAQRRRSAMRRLCDDLKAAASGGHVSDPCWDLDLADLRYLISFERGLDLSKPYPADPVKFVPPRMEAPHWSGRWARYGEAVLRDGFLRPVAGATMCDLWERPTR